MSATDFGAPEAASSDRAAEAARFKDLTLMRQAELSSNDADVVATDVEPFDADPAEAPPGGSTDVI